MCTCLHRCVHAYSGRLLGHRMSLLLIPCKHVGPGLRQTALGKRPKAIVGRCQKDNNNDDDDDDDDDNFNSNRNNDDDDDNDDNDKDNNNMIMIAI